MSNLLSAKSFARASSSFGFDGGDYVCISIETRKEVGENYSALRGFFRQFELTYVVADERDLVRLRTDFAGAFIGSAPPLVLYAIFQRQIIQGITTAGLAGR